MEAARTTTSANAIPDGIGPRPGPVLDTRELRSGEMSLKRFAQQVGVSVVEVRRRMKRRNNPLKPFRFALNNAPIFHESQVPAQAAATQRKNGVPVTREVLNPNGAMNSASRHVPTRFESPYSAEEAAMAFEALLAKKTPIQIVVECKLHPRVVEMICQTFAKMQDAMFLGPEAMHRLSLLPIDGMAWPPESDDELVSAIEMLSNEHCERCKKKTKLFCKGCSIEVARDHIKKVREQVDGVAK